LRDKECIENFDSKTSGNSVGKNVENVQSKNGENWRIPYGSEDDSFWEWEVD
jgi:hypothetical protein